VRYGLFGGLISAAIFTVLYYTRPNPILTTKGYPFEFILIPVLVFFSIKEFRDYKNGGELRFWQGIAIGFVNYSIIALISGVFITIFIKFYDQEILKDFINYNILQMHEKKDLFIEAFNEETFEQVLIDIPKTTAFDIGLEDFVRKIGTGFLITFIISLILRK
jgi:hypothetical protein